MELDDIKRRLAKILALSRRGVGGEKDNAERILQRELSKYNLSIGDIDTESCFSKLEDRLYAFANSDAKKIFVQCLYFLKKDLSSVEVFRRRGTRNSRIVRLSVIDHMELDSMFRYYWALFKKEQELLLKAFINEHNLFGNQTAVKSPKSISQEELEKMLLMMAGLSKSKYVSTRRMLVDSQ